MKRTSLIISGIIGLFVLIGIGAAWVFLSQPADTETAAIPTSPPEKVNTIPVEERPYARLIPSSNGRNLTLVVGDLKKAAAEGEFELEYQSGTLLQGAFGLINVDKLPGQEIDILLGSCSAGGKCSYHEDVSGGSIVLRFEDPEKYALKNDWAFIENSEEETIFSSRDAKFSVEAASLENVKYGVILQTPGLPENIGQPVLSEAYAVSFSSVAKGPFTISMRMKDVFDAVEIWGWDGEEWQILEAEIDEKMAMATSPVLYESYVVVMPSAELE